MTDFAEKHPVVVEGITGITVAGAGFIGTVTVAAAAVKALNVVTNTFNLTLSKTKVGLIIGGVATAGAAIGLYIILIRQRTLLKIITARLSNAG